VPVALITAADVGRTNYRPTSADRADVVLRPAGDGCLQLTGYTAYQLQVQVLPVSCFTFIELVTHFRRGYDLISYQIIIKIKPMTYQQTTEFNILCMLFTFVVAKEI